MPHMLERLLKIHVVCLHAFMNVVLSNIWIRCNLRIFGENSFLKNPAGENIFIFSMSGIELCAP